MLRGAAAGAGALGLALTLTAAVAPAAPHPTTLTIHAFGTATRTSLHLQAGYATVIRADREIDTVAIGDPRIVTATAVKRGRDVYDVILQPQVATGATNMVIWLGTLTTIWDLEVGAALRTADVVYVVTVATRTAVSGGTRSTAVERQARTEAPAPGTTTAAPHDAQDAGTSAGASATTSRDSRGAAPPMAMAPSQPPSSPPRDAQPTADASAPPPVTPRAPMPSAPAGPETTARPTPPASTGPEPGAAAPSLVPPQDAGEAPRSGAPVPAAVEHQASPGSLLARQVIRNVEGRFEMTRGSDGIWVRYQLTNNGDADLMIRPTAVLVRANGRVVPYALARNDADPTRPELLPRGATETGVLEIPGRAIRTVQLILSLFPVSAGDQPPTAIPPVTFQPSFVEVDRLPAAAAP